MSTYIALLLASGHDDVIMRPNIFFILQSTPHKNTIHVQRIFQTAIIIIYYMNRT